VFRTLRCFGQPFDSGLPRYRSVCRGDSPLEMPVGGDRLLCWSAGFRRGWVVAKFARVSSAKME
jgi:hypothetical protein